MGDCGAPGSVVCWKVRGCVSVCVCDGVVVVVVVAVKVSERRGGGMPNTQRTKDWQNSAASVFSLSKLKSLLHAKSVTNEQDRFSPLASSHSFQIHLLNVCFHASWNNIVTCLGLFLPSSLWPPLCRTSRRIHAEELSEFVIVLSFRSPVLHVIDNHMQFPINSHHRKNTQKLPARPSSRHGPDAEECCSALCAQNSIKHVLGVQYLWIL